ncbi:MFS transporter [Schumannella luteola]
MSHAAPDAPARAPLVLAALVLAAVVCNINVASATVALPEVGDAFGASQTLLNLVGVGTGLGLSISVLYLGALADRYGRKQLLIVGLVLTVVASVIAAAAPSIEVLIAARVFTGIAAGMAYPTTLSLITALWSAGPGRTAAIALWASVSGVASVTGSVIAGLVLEVAWWGAAFLLAVPVAIAGLVLVIAVVPSHVNESSEPVDHAGGVLSALGIGSLVLGANLALAPGEQGLGVLLLVASAVLLAGFAWRQSRASHPLFDLSVAGQRLFWVPAMSGVIAVGGLIGAIFVGEQFMQNVLGYDPMQAGFAVVPAAAGLLLMAPVSARLVDARGTRATMLVGYAFVFASFLTMLAWREGTSYVLVGAGFLALGAGAALVLTASSRSLTGITPVARVGMASATSDLQSDLGGSLMSSVLGAILAAGFSRSFAAAIESSPDAATVGDEVTRALQASYASALHVAEQYPQFKDEIIEAARASLQAGAIGAYAVGAVAIAIGAVLVALVLPSHDEERALVETR